jgi:hypothetical protein
MNNKTKDWITAIIALAALLFSLWNFFYAHLRPTCIKIVPDKIIQLVQHDNIMIGINLFCVLIAKGPESRWSVVMFDDAKLVSPDGVEENLSPLEYLRESAYSEESIGRNIPIALKGGDSTNCRVAWQVIPKTLWQPGEYTFSASAKTAGGKLVKVGSFAFNLDSRNIRTLAKTGLLYRHYKRLN